MKLLHLTMRLSKVHGALPSLLLFMLRMFVNADKAPSSSWSLVSLLSTTLVLFIFPSSTAATNANSFSNSTSTDYTQRPRGLELLLGKERSEFFMKSVWGKDSWHHFPASSSSPSYEDLWSLAFIEYHLKKSPFYYDEGTRRSKCISQGTFDLSLDLSLFCIFPRT